MNHRHALCTFSARTLAKCLDFPTPQLQDMHSVTVMVVNLYYADPALLPVRGFGYLIPRSIPLAQNPERALGVVFDSDATIGQDTAVGTKVTVMLGGHWWDEWSSYPDEDEGAALAKLVLRRHLQINAEPTLVHVGLQRECIPQYTVGHIDRMRQAGLQLSGHFRGRLRVAGNSYSGVGLNDCVRSAADAVTGLVEDDGNTEVSGLEGLDGPKAWVYIEKPK